MERRAQKRRSKVRTPGGWRRQVLEHESGWDTRLCLIWGSALVVGMILPVRYLQGGRRFGGYVHTWDTVGSAGSLQAFAVLLPLFLGVAACMTAGLQNSKVRGWTLLVGAVTVVLFPTLVARPWLLGPPGMATFNGPAIGATILLAAPLVAGANRTQKREPRDAPPNRTCRALVALGGIAMLAALFVPVETGGRHDSIAGAVSRGGGVQGLTTFWPILIWVLVVLLYAIVAASHFYPRLRPRKLGPWLSMAARFALLGLPVVGFLAYFLEEDFPRWIGFTSWTLVSVGLFLRIYGVMILMAAGVALVTGPRSLTRRRSSQRSRSLHVEQSE